MENTKLRMTTEKIDYLEKKLDAKKVLLAKATDKGNSDLIERIKVETRSVEQELMDAMNYKDQLSEVN